MIEALRDAASGGLSVGEIMAAAEICSRAAADALLYRMSKAGEISRQGRGRYVLPSNLVRQNRQKVRTRAKITETQGETGAA